MGSTIKPAKTANSRVFVMDGRARADHAPAYHSFVRMTGVSLGLGDVEKIEAPDPRKYGSFIEVGSIRGATERPTTSLEGRYTLDLISDLMKMAAKGCSIDVQVHFGTCQDPSTFNVFDKALVLEDVIITNYSTGELGALASGDNSSIDETIELSGVKLYEIVPIGFSSPGGDVITNEVMDIIFSDSVACGECEEESDGASKIYAVTKAAGGSPGTPPDIVFSLDKGVTWYAYDIDPYSSSEDAVGLAVLTEWLVVISNAANSLAYCYKADLNGVTPPSWTEVTTGFVALYTPRAIASTGSKAYIVGDNGAIYETTDPTTGVTAVSLGSYTAEDLRAVSMVSDDIAVAVGDNGAVVYTTNGVTWAEEPYKPTTSNLTSVYARSEREWYVGSATGHLYYTINQGLTWTEKAFPGSGSGSVADIAASTNCVMWLAHTTAAGAGRILRSYDGGYSWKVTPESVGVIPANDRINALATTPDDANMVIGAGLGDNGTDGIVVVGSA